MRKGKKTIAWLLSLTLMFTMGFGSTLQSVYAEDNPTTTEETQVVEQASPVLEEPEAAETIEQAKDDVEAEGETKSADLEDGDYLAYNMLYIQKNGNKEYVNTDSISMDAFVAPVAIAKGVATYNVDKEKRFDVDGNYVAGVTYEIPIYDVDEESDYYVAIPDVNLGSKKFGSYDFMMSYNNEHAEMIEGYHFDSSIAYIPKTVVDNPDNESKLVEGENVPIAMQMNYYFKNDVSIDKEGNAEFTKTIPVSVLSGEEPSYMEVKEASLFESYISVKTGVKGAKGLSVFLNGTMFPVKDGAYCYDSESGEVAISVTPATVSNINIVFDMPSKASKVKDSLLASVVDKALASVQDDSVVTQEEMKYFKTSGGHFVTLDFSKDMYVGWRGEYKAEIHQTNDADTLKGYRGFENSLDYMYGGYMQGNGMAASPSKLDALWSISSYALGADVMTGNMLGRDELIMRTNEDSSTEKHTIYEWMMKYRNKLEKSSANAIGDTGNPITNSAGNTYGGYNGLGGRNNFAITFPKTVNGAPGNLVSDPNADGYGKGNVDVKFKSVLNDDAGEKYYIAAGCTHLGEEVNAQGDDTDRTVYVTCIGMEDDYVVLSFTTANRSGSGEGQSATSIYKFKTGVPIKLKKDSANAVINKDNVNYSLKGAEYKAYDSEADAKSDKDSIATFTTDENGNTNVETVPPGKLYIKETQRAPKGYAINEDIVEVTVKSDGSEVQTFDVKDVPQNAKVELQKIDKETEKPVPLGGASFEGAEFEVTFTDTENAEEANVKRTWIFKTDEKGYFEVNEAYRVDGDDLFTDMSGEGCVPLGFISIKETKAPEGYLLSDEVITKEITSNTDTEKVDFDSPIKFKEQVKRGHVSWKKVREGSQETMKGVPFVIISTTTGEAHVVVTDDSGRANTDRVVRIGGQGNTYNSTETNKNDSVINPDGTPIVNDEKVVDSSDLTYKRGTWFEKDREGNVCKEVIDTFEDDMGQKVVMGSLPYDTYIVNELPCDLNKGLKLIEGKEFSIREDTEKVDFGTFKNVEEQDLKTTALDNKTKSHFTLAEEEATVIDTVSYDLKANTKYTIKGHAVDKATGETITEIAERSQEFTTGSSDNGTINMVYTFNSKVLEGKTIVFYEYVYDEKGELVKKHEEINDVEQTIYIPSVKTEAKDKASNSHYAKAGTNVTLIDTVKYTNLIPGDEYTVKGELMYKKSGRSTRLTASKTFVAKEANGEVKLEFNFNASKIGGSSLVAFEDLYDSNNKLIGQHHDINDEEQTVHYPGIKTTLKDKKDGDNKISAKKDQKLVDTVKYSNLEKGKEYVLQGYLVNKDNGKKVSKTFSKTFTAKDKSGTVDVPMTVNASKLSGKQLVAYETLKADGKVIAEHKDINDKAQTVSVEKTKAAAKTSKSSPKTGQGIPWILIALIALALGSGGYVLTNRKKLFSK